MDWTYSQINLNRYTERQINILTEKHIDSQTYRLKKTYIYIDRHIDRQKYIQIDINTYRHVNMQT